MVEPISAAAVAAVVARYVLPAIKALGAKIFDEGSDQAADAAVGFGARLLHRLVPRRAGHEPSVEQPGAVAAIREDDVRAGVAALSAKPNDPVVEAVFEADIAKLLAADENRLRAVQELLKSAPQTTVTQAERSIHVGGDNSGVNVSGDSNTITNG